jgi:hypothetical protein
MSIQTDLGWIVKIPDLENIIMDACNAIDQLMLLKENTFTQISPIFCDNGKCYYKFR